MKKSSKTKRLTYLMVTLGVLVFAYIISVVISEVFFQPVEVKEEAVVLTQEERAVVLDSTDQSKKGHVLTAKERASLLR